MRSLVLSALFLLLEKSSITSPSKPFGIPQRHVNLSSVIFLSFRFKIRPFEKLEIEAVTIETA